MRKIPSFDHQSQNSTKPKKHKLCLFNPYHYTYYTYYYYYYYTYYGTTTNTSSQPIEWFYDGIMSNADKSFHSHRTMF